MNRVHEQCPKIDSGTVPSQTMSKQVECSECTACWPSSTPRPCPSLRAACTPRLLPCPRPPGPCPLPRAPAPCPHPCAQPSSQPSARLPYAQWAVAHFRVCTNFLFFFFHFFQPLENTKKYIFIYFLSFSSTPINLLKFISSIFFFMSQQTK